MSDLLDNIKKHLGSLIESANEALGEVTVEASSNKLLALCEQLKNRDEFHFEQLVDLCGVDYLHYGIDEWDTHASSRGFSRAVESKGSTTTGRLSFDDQTKQEYHGKRFASVIHLISYKNNQRLRIKTFAQDNDFPEIPSVSTIWDSANWYEREAFDLFGIVYPGHPDLRRIMTDYGFIGHPFRKDFPQIGHVEMRFDPELNRVIYEPVSIEPRVLVPKTIRADQHHLHAGDSKNEE